MSYRCDTRGCYRRAYNATKGLPRMFGRGKWLFKGMEMCMEVEVDD